MIDRRGKLEALPFSYDETKDGKIHIHFHGRTIMVLKDKQADTLRKRLSCADEKQRQLALAKVTGNFKKGNGQ